MRCPLVISFNIVSMEANFGSGNIFSLSSVVKPNIGLERGGQANLHIITKVILTQFCNLHNNLIDLNAKHAYYY